LAQAEAEAQAALGIEEKAGRVTAPKAGIRIVGLVAARLKEKFGRPAFDCARARRIGTGSAAPSQASISAARFAAPRRRLLLKGVTHAADELRKGAPAIPRVLNALAPMSRRRDAQAAC